MLDSLHCVNIVLSQDIIDELNAVSAIEMGFPHDFLASEAVKTVVTGGTFDAIVR